MKIKDIKLENSLWSAQLTIVSDDRQELERIFENAGKVDPEKEYTVKIEPRWSILRNPGQSGCESAFSDVWSSHGIAWFCDDIGPCKKTLGYHNLRAFYGTSEYDTKAMARLIDEVVEECKAQGIETMSKKELDNLIGGQKNE